MCVCVLLQSHSVILSALEKLFDAATKGGSQYKLIHFKALPAVFGASTFKGTRAARIHTAHYVVCTVHPSNIQNARTAYNEARCDVLHRIYRRSASI